MILYEVMVDWDMTDWRDTPNFSESYDNISNDVQTIDIQRGKEIEDGNSPAATLEIRLKPGLISKYSAWNALGTLYGKILPWRIIRVRATNDNGGTWWPVYFGFIEKYLLEPHPEKQAVTFYCTDGVDLLARQLINQDFEVRDTITEGEAINRILTAAGWSDSRRDITDGAILQYPATGEY